MALFFILDPSTSIILTSLEMYKPMFDKGNQPEQRVIVVNTPQLPRAVIILQRKAAPFVITPSECRRSTYDR